MKVFISGPVSGHFDYKYKFNEAENKLKSLGYEVVNPAKILDFDSNLESDKESHLLKYDIMMNNCYELIDECDSIYHIEGWRKSEGCLAEHRYAQLRGKNMLYEEQIYG